MYFDNYLAFPVQPCHWNHTPSVASHIPCLPRANSPVVRHIQVSASMMTSPVNSPHKGQWREALMISMICTWINGWVNSYDAGDLRPHRAHCDVILMSSKIYNSLASGRFGSDFKNIIFKLIIQKSSWRGHCEITLRWMLHNLTKAKLTLVLVLTSCHQATSQYLRRGWITLMSLNVVTRPRWVWHIKAWIKRPTFCDGIYTVLFNDITFYVQIHYFFVCFGLQW